MDTDEYLYKEPSEDIIGAAMTIIVDPKCVTEFIETHYAQMIGYLAITGLRLALLLNFKEAKLRWKRVIR